jgi:uncharacterized membrane protein YtjA (UPF0391 family)
LWRCAKVAERVTDPGWKGFAMISWALAFLIIAILAALLGFSGIAGPVAWMAKALFALFLLLFLASIAFSRKRTSKAERLTKESQ